MINDKDGYARELKFRKPYMAPKPFYWVYESENKRH